MVRSVGCDGTAAFPISQLVPKPGSTSRFVEIHDTEEKGSDVNLAVHLLNDGWHGRYDVALVLSQDTDLIEPLRIASQELGKTIGLDGLTEEGQMRILSQRLALSGI